MERELLPISSFVYTGTRKETSIQVCIFLCKYLCSFDLQVAYTFDAGPNAVLIARDRKAATLLVQRLLYYFPPNSDDLDRCFLTFSSCMHTPFLDFCPSLEFLSYLQNTLPSVTLLVTSQLQRMLGSTEYRM